MSHLFNIFINLGLSTGLSIILLSISISLLLLPIDYLIEKRKKKLKPKLQKIQPIKEEIERAYTGQSRFYYLKTLYRQNQYSFLDQFLPSFSLLIQIPVFILAYHFLKSQNFQNTSFLFIKDLSLNDGLITWKGMGLNALPILMTLINLFSIELQVGADRSSKVLLRLISFLFLFLLYSMPSAMVLYWLTSNLIALVKLLLKEEGRFNLKIFLNNQILNSKEKLKSTRTDPIWPVGSLLLSVYCFLFYFASNKHNGGAWKTGIIFIFCSILFLTLQIKSKIRTTSTNKFNFSNLMYSLLFLYIPVWYYFLGNPDFFKMNYALEIFLRLILPLAILGGILGFTLWKLKISQHAFLIYLSLAFTYLGMPFFNFQLNLTPTRNFPVPIFLGISLYCVLKKVDHFTKNKLIPIGAITSLILGFVCCLTVLNTTDILTTIKAISNSKPQKSFSSHLPKLKRKPDVYFLVYDSYMDEKFFDFLGLDNKAVTTFLQEKNFRIYPQKLSLENFSLGSIGRLYQSFDQHKSEQNDVEFFRHLISGNNHLDQYLSSQGYVSTNITSSYFSPKNGRTYKDVQIPHSVGNVILRGLLSGSMNSETVTNENSDLNPWQNLKDKYFSPHNTHARWVYIHNYLPGHSPTNKICSASWLKKFKKSLKNTNEVIIRDVNTIISNNPNAIVIIAGDHGPHLQRCKILSSMKKHKEATQLIDEYGVHISIRWPTKDYEKYDKFHYLQGVFHSIIAYLTEDPSLLKSQPTGMICQNEICAGHDTPITAGPDKGKMIYDTI